MIVTVARMLRVCFFSIAHGLVGYALAGMFARVLRRSSDFAYDHIPVTFRLEKSEDMRHFISRWLVLTIAAAVMVALLPGMETVGEPPILGVAAFSLFMALINASIKPVVHLLALPISILSLGLFALVLNWLFMELASWLALSLFDVGVVIDGFWWSVLGSLIMSIVSSIVSDVIGE